MTDIGTDYIELGVLLHETLPLNVDGIPSRSQIADTVRQLILCSRRLHDLAAIEVGRPLSPSDEKKREAVTAQVQKLLTPFGIDPIFGGELKLVLPNGETNDTEGAGWLVPR